MAKKRKVETTRDNADRDNADSTDAISGNYACNMRWTWSLRDAPAAILSGILVYSQYHPSDSVAVERGDALWFSAFAICLLIAWATVMTFTGTGQWLGRNLKSLHQGVLDILPWSLAIWIFIAAMGSCPPGNLRSAANEAWVWIAAAAVFTVSRGLFSNPNIAGAALSLIFGLAISQAVHAIHQQYVSLPQTRASYEANPDEVLRLAGIDAMEGSAARIVFENRLRDGGPTGSFALANSLAGVLVVGFVAVISGIRFRWRDIDPWERVLWIVAVGILLFSLVITNSRSAVAAAMFGPMVLFVVSWCLWQNRRLLIGALASFTVIGVVIVAGFLLWGKDEWIEQAPASLAFRFQYWRTTIEMAKSMPLFGAGPGNFQAIYERFREPTANEQIAEPHNFFFETLAAGGWIAAVLLALLALSLLVSTKSMWSNRSKAHDGEGIAKFEHTQSTSPYWIWAGAIISLFLVWGLGIMTLRIPDFDAATFAIPFAVASTALGWRTFSKLTIIEREQTSFATFAAIMLHLCVSGGWTVPGVNTLVSVVAAMFVCSEAKSLSENEACPLRRGHNPNEFDSPPKGPSSFRIGSKRNGNAVGLSGTSLLLMSVLLMGGLVYFSMIPVAREQSLIESAMVLRTRGAESATIDTLLQKAQAADPWSAEAIRFRADVFRWELVELKSDEGENAERIRASIEQLLVEIRSRAGEDPAVYREIGGIQLHLYQRFGRQKDLLAALATFKQAADWSPSNQWMFAQLSEVAREAGEESLAHKSAERAHWLSQLGYVMDRVLDWQMIMPARHYGAEVMRGPVRRPASELLLNHLAP